MKALVLLIPLVLVVSCASTGGGRSGSDMDSGGRKEINGLEEMSLEYIETLWGAPDTSIPAGAGKTVRFKNIRAEDEDPITEKVSIKFCDIRLEVNEKQLVQSWQYEICRPK